MKTTLTLVSISSCCNVLSQNLVVNGSMTSAKGANVVAPGWSYSSNTPTNTPDINDTSGPLLTTQGYTWLGTPVLSPDGGTWQNTYSGEGVKQTINGITVGAVYYFSYYYTAQGITTGFASYPGNQSLPNVTINGATDYVNPDFYGTPFQWKYYCGALIADSTSIVITASGPSYNNEGYMAYDGFYLSQTPLTFSQITQQPLNATICAYNNAAFTVQTSGTDSVYWEVNDESSWLYLQDTGSYSGTHTATLNISHAAVGMNNFQYRCYVVGSTCPVYSSEATLIVNPLPIPSLKVNASSPEICKGASLTITAGSGYASYLWNDNSNASTLTVKQPGLYWVEVTDSNNCSGKDSITILPCEQFFIPNAFTPNNDGIDDIFKPIIFGVLINYKFSIYNRWGQLVFQSSDINKGWNGMLNGSAQPTGVFVWTCRFQTEGKKEDYKKGTVILIR